MLCSQDVIKCVFSSAFLCMFVVVCKIMYGCRSMPKTSLCFLIGSICSTSPPTKAEAEAKTDKEDQGYPSSCTLLCGTLEKFMKHKPIGENLDTSRSKKLRSKYI